MEPAKRRAQVRLVLDDARHDFRDVFSLEEAAAGGEFVEDDAEGPYVGPRRVDRFTLRPVRGPCRRRFPGSCRRGWRRCSSLAQSSPGGLLAHVHLREAEVEDFYGAIGLDHDVAGFESRYERPFVRGFEPAAAI